MKVKNINNEMMKKFNVRSVLKLIFEEEPISRTEIAQTTGLTSSSITNIVNRLKDGEFVQESSLGNSSGGRKPINLIMNPNVKFIIGIELNAENIIGLVANFRTEKISKKVIPTNLNEGNEKVISRMIMLINDLIKEANISKEKILGIGIAAPGPYDHNKGILSNPPNFPGWVNVPICEIIEQAIDIPVYLEKETTAAALAEFMFGLGKNYKNLFVIYACSIGIGGGAIINGKIYHGFSDGAGDIGHMIISVDGPKCRCGDRGCLEAMASGIYIKNKVISKLKENVSSKIADNLENMDDIDLKDIIRCASEGDELCRGVIDETAKNLGIGISNIINLFSPEMIILGGDLTLACNEYSNGAIKRAKSRLYPQYNKEIIIKKTSFGDELCAMGAISIVFQRFFDSIDSI